jgi:uncharacterized membrane protein YeaQ/YmgE (transglycosylase-associated protein family)
VIGDILVGAFVGGFLFGLLGPTSVGLFGALVTATTGAVVSLSLIRRVESP